MYDLLEVSLATQLIEHNGGKVFRVYSRHRCIALYGLMKGEDGKKNSLFEPPLKKVDKKTCDHINCFSS